MAKDTIKDSKKSKPKGEMPKSSAQSNPTATPTSKPPISKSASLGSIVKSKSKSTPKSKATVSDSDTSSDSESDSDSSSESESSDSLPSPSGSEPESESESEPTSKLTYTVPPNSTPLQFPPATANAPNPFSSSSLSKKHLWLITAPAGIPPDALDGLRIPVSALSSGAPVVDIKGRSYGLRTDEEDAELETEEGNAAAAAAGITVLVPAPGSKPGKYAVASKSLTRTFHLTLIPPSIAITTTAVSTSTSSTTPASTSRRPPKPARPQPPDLKMRYQPFGAGPKLPGAEYFGSVDVSDDGNIVPRKVTDGGVSGKDSGGDVAMGGTERKDRVDAAGPDAAEGGGKKKKRKVEKEKGGGEDGERKEKKKKRDKEGKEAKEGKKHHHHHQKGTQGQVAVTVS